MREWGSALAVGLTVCWFWGWAGVLLRALGSAAEPSAPVMVLDIGMVALALIGVLLTGRRAWR